MTARIIDPITGREADLTNARRALDSGGIIPEAFPRPLSLVTPDAALRAEFRLWGSWPRSMAAMNGKVPECEPRGIASGRMSILVGHDHRVYLADDDRDLYAWTCSCGLSDGPDYLHAAYAEDGWREAHDLAPITNHPLV